jgi:hypothetical protein
VCSVVSTRALALPYDVITTPPTAAHVQRTTTQTGRCRARHAMQWSDGPHKLVCAGTGRTYIQDQVPHIPPPPGYMRLRCPEPLLQTGTLPPLCRSLPILLRINTNRSPVCSAGLLPTCDPYQASRGLPASGASWTQCLRSPVARHYNRPSELGKLQPLPSPCALGLSSTEARRPTTNRYLQTGRCRRRSR